MNENTKELVTPQDTIYQLTNTPPAKINQEIERLVSTFKEDVDYGTIMSIRTGQPIGKPSLWKPGAEKVCVMFNLMPRFSRDSETLEMLGIPKGLVCLKCELIDRSTEKVVGEGRGSAMLGDKQRDANSTVKMAEKSAQIDAILRTFALSQRFTQDLEDIVSNASQTHTNSISGQENPKEAYSDGEPKTDPSKPISSRIKKTASEEDKAKAKDFVTEALTWAIAMEEGDENRAKQYIIGLTGFEPKDKPGTTIYARWDQLLTNKNWAGRVHHKVKEDYQAFMKGENYLNE